MRRAGKAGSAKRRLSLLAAGALLPLLLLPHASRSESTDRALAAFERPPVASSRETGRGAPVDRHEWERRLRPADRFGPPPLRPDDAALLIAARSGRWTDVTELLKSGRASANARDDAGGHALVDAARAGEDAVVRLLIQRGAELDRSGQGFTALGAAAYAGHRSTVRLLLRAGADPTRLGASGQAPLHLASLAGRLDVVKELLRGGTDLELLNRQRESALDVAAAAGQQEVMDHLIQGGADLTRAGRR